MPCGTNGPVSFSSKWITCHARHANSPPSCLPDYRVRPAAYDGEVSGRLSSCETSCQRGSGSWEWRMCVRLHGETRTGIGRRELIWKSRRALAALHNVWRMHRELC